MIIYILLFIIIIIFLYLFFFNNKNKRKFISKNISIGIPCTADHIQFLEELIYNINKQDILPKEIIISLSSSNNSNNLKKTLNKISLVNVKLIETDKKQYAGENRNICAQNCSTEYISFIDADDLMAPSRNKVIEDLIKKTKFDVLYHNFTDSKYKLSNNYNEIKDTNYNKKVYLKQKDEKHPNLEYITHGHLTIKTNVLLENLMDTDGYGEDSRYLHKIFSKNLNVISLPDYKGTLYRIENSTWK